MVTYRENIISKAISKINWRNMFVKLKLLSLKYMSNLLSMINEVLEALCSLAWEDIQPIKQQLCSVNIHIESNLLSNDLIE